MIELSGTFVSDLKSRPSCIETIVQHQAGVIEIVVRTADLAFAMELNARLKPDMVLVSIGTQAIEPRDVRIMLPCTSELLELRVKHSSSKHCR